MKPDPGEGTKSFKDLEIPGMKNVVNVHWLPLLPASKKHPDSPSGFGWDVKRVSDCLKPIWRISILLPLCLVQMEGDLSLLMDVAVKFSPLLV